jgi:hypothetical protein
MDYEDRLTAGTEFTTGEGVDVGVAPSGDEVEWLGFIEGPLFVRAQCIAEAYKLHVLSGIEFYDESQPVKAQCESLVEEIAFVSGVVNDDALRDALVVLRDAALRVVRSPTEMLLVLAGP